ncbi:MAG: hypothetical protein KJ077_10345 [Anaerolineae bacterium]|nr:hypothetical protein [Anaerolineae bacterium]
MRKRIRRKIRASVQFYPAIVMAVTSDGGEEAAIPIPVMEIKTFMKYLLIMLLHWMGAWLTGQTLVVERRLVRLSERLNNMLLTLGGSLRGSRYALSFAWAWTGPLAG